MNENFQNEGSGRNLEADALLARVVAADPATGFDATTLSSTLVDDAVARAAAKPTPNFARRQASRLGDKLAQAYRNRPRFVLGSAVSGLASVAAIALVATVALKYGLGNGTSTSMSIAPELSGCDTVVNGVPCGHGVIPEFSSDQMKQGSATKSSVIAAGGVNMGVMRSAQRPVNYTFEADPSLSTQAGAEHVYQVRLPEDPKTLLQKVIDVFGVEGDIIKSKYDGGLTTNKFEGEIFRVLKDHGVKSVAQLSGWRWYFENFEVTPGGVNSCDMDLAKSDPNSCSWAPKEADAVPTHDEVTGYVAKIVESFGFHIDESQINVHRSRYGTDVQVYLPTISSFVQNDFSFSWNERGELTDVSGYTPQVIDMGVQATISPTEAVQRANDKNFKNMVQPWVDPSGAVVYAGTGVAIHPPGADLTPIEKLVTVTDFRGTITEVVDAQGVNWVVPAYILISGKDEYGLVPATLDGFIDIKY